jgi:hypothetical protein
MLDTVIPFHLNTIHFHLNTQNSSYVSRGLSWRLYWTLVSQKKGWIRQLLKVSAKDAPNRGSVFTFGEFKKLVTTKFEDVVDICFPVFIVNRFLAVSLLLGALRTEQLDRFRSGGLNAIEFDRTNKDKNHPCVFSSKIKFYRF